MDSQAFQFLLNLPPFSFLPEEELEKIASELSTVHHLKDTVLFIHRVDQGLNISIYYKRVP